MSLQQVKLTSIPNKRLKHINGGQGDYLMDTSRIILPPDVDPNDPEAIRQYLIRQSWLGSGPGGHGI